MTSELHGKQDTVNYVYNKNGMAGVNIAIQDCYVKAQRSKSESAIEQCFLMDVIASEIDSAFVTMIRRPDLVNSENKTSAVNSRVNRALELLEVDDTLRKQKISEWESVAPAGLKEIH